MLGDSIFFTMVRRCRAFAVVLVALATWAAVAPRTARRPDRDAACDRGEAHDRAWSATRTAIAMPLSNFSWASLGPTTISGRATALAFNPAHPETWFAAAADGGVWRTSDGGASFAPVFDSMGVQSIGALAASADGTTLYVGTGEANASADTYPGAGLFASTDDGATWSARGLGVVPYLADILIDPRDHASLFVAGMGRLDFPDTLGGLFATTDGGARWRKILAPGVGIGAISVARLATAQPVLLCATWQRLGNGLARKAGRGSALWRSTDGGLSWSAGAVGLPAPDSFTGRIAVAAAPSEQATAYCAIEHLSSISDFGGVFVTTDAGLSWRRVTEPDEAAGFAERQGWYNRALVVDPRNARHVLFGDVDLYETYDGGATWANISNSYGFQPATHADQHAAAFHPVDSTIIVVANDGGTWTVRRDGPWTLHPMPTVQFYSSDLDPQLPGYAIGGTQDNGTLVRLDAPVPWAMTLTGDGGDVALNPARGASVLAGDLYGGLHKSFMRGLGGSWYGDIIGIDWSQPSLAVPPIRWSIDSTLVLVPTDRLYQSSDGGASWSVMPGAPVLTGGAWVSALAPPRADGAGGFDVAFTGTDGALHWRAAGAWHRLTIAGAVTSMAWVPGAMAWIVGGADTSGGFVQMVDTRDTTGGWRWNCVAPVAAVVAPARWPGVVVVGTDRGAAVVRDSGRTTTWLTGGMPPTAVVALEYDSSRGVVRAATHGRGMLEFPLDAFLRGSAVPMPSRTTPANELLVAPTVASTVLRIAVPEGRAREVDVYNSSGLCIMRRSIRGAEVEPVASWPTGVYLILTRDAPAAARKVLVVH